MQGVLDGGIRVKTIRDHREQNIRVENCRARMHKIVEV